MVNYHYEGVAWRMPLEEEVATWVRMVIEQHGQLLDMINFVFVTDQLLLELNQTYLNHDYYTDILSFDYSDGADFLFGDIFISLDRVAENAASLGLPFIDELHRVMIHGVLHFLGQNDQDEEQRALMRRSENRALALRMF